MISAILALMLSVSNPVPPSISLIGLDAGPDHTYCCTNRRGCWAYHPEHGWMKFRRGDCATWPWEFDPFSNWRCKCPKRGGYGHRPASTDQRDRRQV